MNLLTRTIRGGDPSPSEDWEEPRPPSQDGLDLTVVLLRVLPKPLPCGDCVQAASNAIVAYASVRVSHTVTSSALGQTRHPRRPRLAPTRQHNGRQTSR